MGYDNIVLNSMSRFYHEQLNANFGQILIITSGLLIESKQLSTDKVSHGRPSIILNIAIARSRNRLFFFQNISTF